jgi:hypothetical protein
LWLLFGRLSFGGKVAGRDGVDRKLETLERATRWSGPRFGWGLRYLSRKRSCPGKDLFPSLMPSEKVRFSKRSVFAITLWGTAVTFDYIPKNVSA